MKISGFTFCRNAAKLFYPVKESIESVLPLVDEFVVALGPCDEDDDTEDQIRKIGSDKIKIINTCWDLQEFPGGTEYAHQTDIAKEACTGDWLFYIQGDEAVHEKYLPLIKSSCEKYLHDKKVDGFLFKYKHFWGDFNHYVVSHAWYANEIRIIRNDPDFHSWRDAQSFRKIPFFNGRDYNQKENTHKLNVVALDAFIYHYGFVRPPHIMQKKRKNHHGNYKDHASADEKFKNEKTDFDYGDLSKLSLYKGTHPSAMKPFIEKFNWGDQLHYGPVSGPYSLQKHEKWKYRLLTFIEQHFLKGHTIMGFKNYHLSNK